MREYKPDSICKECSRSYSNNHHKCWFTAKEGTIFDSARSGRLGLSKDGRSCKYFYPKGNTDAEAIVFNHLNDEIAEANKDYENQVLDLLFRKGVDEMCKETPDKKFKVLVDIIKYDEVYNNCNEIIKQNDYSKRFEEMEVTGLKLKELLDNCIDVKVLDDEI